MSMTLTQDTAVLAGQVTVEEAEELLAWLVKHPSASVDLQALDHLHAANLQVLMAARPRVAHWPQNPDTCLWLQAALTP
jgi:anti-anti-sigma regulatory factor